MPAKDKYANPELRDQVKQDIHESDKGGAPGQWSAHKAQMMAQEYKRRGGEYNTDPSQKDESQKNLDKWTEEEWQTKEGSGHAQQADGTEKRYLPKKAWEKMNEEEKHETEEKKVEGSKEGKQHVGNAESAKEKRKEVREEVDEQHDEVAEGDAGNAEEGDEEADGDTGEEDGDFDDAEQDEQDEDENEDDVEQEPEGEDATEKKSKAGQKEQGVGRSGDKRKAKSHANGNPNKKQKSTASNGTIGSKHISAEEPAPRGSADRLPEVGSKICWKALSGYIDGTVKEIVKNNQTIDGKSVKASDSDPRLVLTSEKSGKICVHKPDACFYE